ncbi:hypothetical protein HYALB_00006671 [Hymenoscyphus albidus]|uniref:Uncharacterized protein n=1 Tax=Hymenoscyphus albidus TaxID=595503 RepID=A0A9N9LJ12_9HELO|nr:hypothetical protein HYALB_00006671 [Hymenoscyphus albidus]
MEYSDNTNFIPTPTPHHHFSHEPTASQIAQSMAAGGILAPSGATYLPYNTTMSTFGFPTSIQQFSPSLNSQSQTTTPTPESPYPYPYYYSHLHSPSDLPLSTPPELPISNTTTTTPLTTLHTQRTYLLSTLAHENHHATTLLTSLAPLTTLPPPYSRRTRKRLTHFCHRLNETTKQETAILSRVNQLTAKINRREYVDALQRERRSEEMLRENARRAVEWLPLDKGWTPVVERGVSLGLDGIEEGMMEMGELRITTPLPLDPTSPSFRPGIRGWGQGGFPFPVLVVSEDSFYGGMGDEKAGNGEWDGNA